jgi:hypothetical protein
MGDDGKVSDEIHEGVVLRAVIKKKAPALGPGRILAYLEGSLNKFVTLAALPACTTGIN